MLFITYQPIDSSQYYHLGRLKTKTPPGYKNNTLKTPDNKEM